MIEKYFIFFCTSFSNGKRHDFRLFKESKVHILPRIKILADSGYRGMQKIIANVDRKTKKHPLTKEKRIENQELSKQKSSR